MRDIARFFARNQIQPEQLIYLTRENQRTVLYLLDGHVVTTSIPQKDIRAWLGEEDFINISKGITVRKDQIVDISAAGVYTMTDGRRFNGRQRHMTEHKLLRRELLPLLPPEESHETPMELLRKCELMDAMPLPFCVIELTFDANGHGIDFVFRYCNAAQLALEGLSGEEVLDRSFYSVFPDGDKKWLVLFADVALNGSHYKLRDYNARLKRTITFSCYCPQRGYCACLIITED